RAERGRGDANLALAVETRLTEAALKEQLWTHLPSEAAVGVRRYRMPAHSRADDEQVRGRTGGDTYRDVIPRRFPEARAEAHAPRELGEPAGRRVDGGELQRIRVALVVEHQGQPLAARRGVEQGHETGPLRVVVRMDQDIGDQRHRGRASIADHRGSVRGVLGQPRVPRGAGAPGEV